MRGLRVLAAISVAAVLSAGCSDDPTGGYCESVEEHQVELSDIAAAGATSEPGAIFDALEPYRELRDDAPRDLADEWKQVIDRLEVLEAALDEAGVDPSTYDPETTLETLPAEQRRAIEGAARDLGDDATVQAMAGLEQQALDVCRMPLSQ